MRFRAAIEHASLSKTALTVGALVILSGTVAEAEAVLPPQNRLPEASQPSQQGDLLAPKTGVTKGAIGGQDDTRAGLATAPSSLDIKPTNNEVQGLSWINRQPAGNYTLQLMAAVSPAPLLAFVHREPLTGPYAIAGFRKDDKVLYLLLLGSYATPDEAKSAAAPIEERGAGVHPWVRRFGSLPALYDSTTPPAPVEPEVHAPRPLPAVMGAAWLWSRNPVHHTIQLMGDRRDDSLRAFVNRHRPAAPVAIVRVRRMGKPWYLLLSGDYSSEEATLTALKALPREMCGAGPWPRSFASLQDQMVVGNH